MPDWLNALIPGDPAMLAALNLTLHILHSAMVLFVLFGLLVPGFRRAHLWLLGVIWLSWLGLGLMVGHVGYCILTDWHWRVLWALGERDLPASYIEMMLLWLWPHDIDDAALRYVIAAVFLSLTGLSLWLNRHRKRLTGAP